MHHVFFVNEIFMIICESVAESHRGLAALAALAQTCRSLKEISLDVLWGRGPVDFLSVLKTLPPDSWSEIEFPFVRLASFMRSERTLTLNNIPQSLSRPISSGELTRLRQYTTRVTHLLVIDDASMPVQTLKTLIAPHESFDWLAMWPKVKNLYWITPPEHLPFLKHFLTLDIRNLKIKLEGAEDMEVQEVLSLVESCCMNLEGLHLIDSETRDSEEIQDTMRQIVYNNSLSLMLFYPPQDPSAPLVNDILQLPVLQALEMHIPQIPDPTPWNILPSLEYLSFTLDESSDIIELLGTLEKSRLKEFSLICPYPTSEDDRAVLAEFFEDSGLCDSVESFTWKPTLDGGAPTWEFVTTLDSFANIQALDLNASCGSACCFKFRHEHVIELSLWMPQLRELNFGGPPCAFGGITSNVGYHTLVVLAKNCPNLLQLTIHFNIRTFMTSGYVEPNRNLAMWHLGDTAVPNNAQYQTMFALAVSKLFPNVTFMATETNARGWDMIQEEHRMLTLPAVHRELDLM